MAAPRKLPPTQRLYEMAQAGLTHQQIADAIKAETGEEVSRGAVSAALSRAGRSNPKNRYTVVLPWRVKVIHLKEYPARMLRLLGRRISDIPLSHQEEERLDAWLAMLWRENAIVAYDPDNTHQGFHYIERTDADDPHVPIRKQRIYT
jgi:hypothetical protein